MDLVHSYRGMGVPVRTQLVQSLPAGAVFGAVLPAGVDNWMVMADLRPWLQEAIRGFILLMIAFLAVRSTSGPKLFIGTGRNG